MSWEPTDEEVRAIQEAHRNLLADGPGPGQSPEEHAREYARTVWAVSPGPRRTEALRCVTAELRKAWEALAALCNHSPLLGGPIDKALGEADAALDGEPAEPDYPVVPYLDTIEPDPRDAVVTAAREFLDLWDSRVVWDVGPGQFKKLASALHDALREVKP